nr:Chain A, Alpha-conotoxin Vc1A [Conus victoriae]
GCCSDPRCNYDHPEICGGAAGG